MKSIIDSASEGLQNFGRSIRSIPTSAGKGAYASDTVGQVADKIKGGVKKVINKVTAPLGSGQRFSRLKTQLASKPGVKDPAALAASIGRKKYGAQQFSRLGQAGKT